ncbi:hypothetical protein [Fangia hongkongensis]|uniref:hypothetical protein n=1 Tax=Fangia hongkongensis TaxID=270495 RepID=UPI00036F5C38|nr:hypothetical protein [Fangia hongkongensis]
MSIDVLFIIIYVGILVFLAGAISGLLGKKKACKVLIPIGLIILIIDLILFALL